MQIVLFDNKQRTKLYPFTVVKSVADLKFGMFSMQERWNLYLNQSSTILTTDILQPLYNELPIGDILLIDAAIVANEKLAEAILSLQLGHYLSYKKGFIAGRIFVDSPLTLEKVFSVGFNDVHSYDYEITRIDSLIQIIENNGTFIEADFKKYTSTHHTQNIDASNTIIAPSQIFIEKGGTITCSILNASNGPIYIGKNATIMEGSLIRGPFVLGDNAVVKMGSKIYGGTSVGKNCVVGGEIKNVAMHNYSNKAHDGYLGDSIVGEWCNFGAGTSNSNIKNSAGNVSVYNNYTQQTTDAGNKCGAFIGHYTKFAINSSINTGSVFGISCNIFANGLLPKNVTNFTWGIDEKYEIDKAIEAISNWQLLKNMTMSESEKKVLKEIYNQNN